MKVSGKENKFAHADCKWNVKNGYNCTLFLFQYCINNVNILLWRIKEGKKNPGLMKIIWKIMGITIFLDSWIVFLGVLVRFIPEHTPHLLPWQTLTAWSVSIPIAVYVSSELLNQLRKQPELLTLASKWNG